MLVTLQPPALSNTPMLLAVTPLPRPLTTPEVGENKVKNCFLLLKVRSGSLGKKVRCTTTTRGARDSEVRNVEQRRSLTSCHDDVFHRDYLVRRKAVTKKRFPLTTITVVFAAFVDRRAERLCRFPGALCTLNRDSINVAMSTVLDRWY